MKKNLGMSSAVVVIGPLDTCMRGHLIHVYSLNSLPCDNSDITEIWLKKI